MYTKVHVHNTHTEKLKCNETRINWTKIKTKKKVKMFTNFYLTQSVWMLTFSNDSEQKWAFLLSLAFLFFFLSKPEINSVAFQCVHFHSHPLRSLSTAVRRLSDWNLFSVLTTPTTFCQMSCEFVKNTIKWFALTDLFYNKTGDELTLNAFHAFVSIYLYRPVSLRYHYCLHSLVSKWWFYWLLRWYWSVSLE